MSTSRDQLESVSLESDDVRLSPTACGLMIDPPAGGAWNMALDEGLLSLGGHSGRAVLRIYQWSQPTLSIGYFQPVAARAGHPESAGCPLVRRRTGGGAILHDAEMTYSLCLPKAVVLAKNTSLLYSAVHDSLIAALKTLGVLAEQRSCIKPAGLKSASMKRTGTQSSEPFLCFERQSPGDVLCQGVKIIGSAQRRSRNAVLQHGSVLLRRSRFAPQLPGIADLIGVDITGEHLIEAWLPHLQAKCGLMPVLEPATDSLLKFAVASERDKFAHARWNHRR